jgi:hypothetical protein
MPRSAVLRAVYGGGATPGVISNLTYVAVTPALTLSAGTPSGGRVAVAGTVAPGKPRVTVAAYRGRKRVGSRRLRAADGDFAGTVSFKGKPDRLVARVPADSATAAAAVTIKLTASR